MSGTVGINSSFTAAAGSTIAAPSGGSGALQVTGGTFSLAGTFSTSIVTIAGGTLTGTGSGTLASGSQVTLSSGAVAGMLTSAGTLDLTGTGAKTFAGTLTNAGTLTISGSSVILDGTLTNSGTVDVTGAGTISVNPSVATINNQAGATFDFQADATLSNVYTGNGAAYPTAFNNAGTLEKSAGSGTTTIDFLLNNTGGTLSNTSPGTLELSGGGTIAGSTIVSGTVGINSSFTAAAGSTIAAPSGGSGGLQITGGTFSLAGTVTTSIVTIAGGALNGTGSGTLASGSQVTLSSGTVAGTLTSAGTMDLTGTGAKTLSGTLTNAGTLTISGSSVILNGTLTNSGTVDVTGAGTISVNPSVVTINNQAGATFDFQADATLSNVYIGNGATYPTAFNNTGTLEKSAGSGTTTINFPLNNSGGTVEVRSGTFSIANDGIVSNGTLSTGTWVVGSDSTLTISGVTSIATLSANVALQGSAATFTGLSQLVAITSTGEFELQDGGSFTTAGNLDNAGTVNLAAGTLTVTGNYTQESTGTYAVGIGGISPGSQYGQLVVTKQASLNGGLSVSPIDGYIPPQGDSYQIVTFSSETGNFSAEFGLYFGSDEGFSPTFSPSTNPTALVLVVVAENAGSQTAVQSSEDPANYGDTVTFTATVTPTVSTNLVPTGQVTFYDGSTAIDTATLVNGSATYVPSPLAVGKHAITAQYVGDSNFSGSNSTVLYPDGQSGR